MTSKVASSLQLQTDTPDTKKNGQGVVKCFVCKPERETQEKRKAQRQDLTQGVGAMRPHVTMEDEWNIYEMEGRFSGNPGQGLTGPWQDAGDSRVLPMTEVVPSQTL